MVLYAGERNERRSNRPGVHNADSQSNYGAFVQRPGSRHETPLTHAAF